MNEQWGDGIQTARPGRDTIGSDPGPRRGSWTVAAAGLGVAAVVGLAVFLWSGGTAPGAAAPVSSPPASTRPLTASAAATTEPATVAAPTPTATPSPTSAPTSGPTPTATGGAETVPAGADTRWWGTRQVMEIRSAKTVDGAVLLTVRPGPKGLTAEEVYGGDHRPGVGRYAQVATSPELRFAYPEGDAFDRRELLDLLERRTEDREVAMFEVVFDRRGVVTEVYCLIS